MEKLNDIEVRAKLLARAWVAIMDVNVRDILAIAEAFRALEQRAEAAEAKIQAVTESRDQWEANAREFSRCADRLEAKLSELEKQTPIYQLMEHGNWYDAEAHVFTEATNNGNIGRIVYTRPAPAINLAELVPPMKDRNMIAHVYLDETTVDKPDAYTKGFNECRAAILRNIENMK